MKAISGYYDVKAHGLDNSIKLFDTPINAETLEKILKNRKDYIQGTSIRLLCCYTGKVKDGACFV